MLYCNWQHHVCHKYHNKCLSWLGRWLTVQWVFQCVHWNYQEINPKKVVLTVAMIFLGHRVQRHPSKTILEAGHFLYLETRPRFELTALCWKSPWGIVIAQLCYLCLLAVECCSHTSRQEHFPLRPQSLWHSMHYGQLHLEAHPALLVPLSFRSEHHTKICKHSHHAHSFAFTCRAHSKGYNTRTRSAEHILKAPAQLPDKNN